MKSKAVLLFITFLAATSISSIAKASEGYVGHAPVLEFADFYNHQLPAGATNVSVVYNTVLVSTSQPQKPDFDKFDMDRSSKIKSDDFELLKAQGPGYPGTPKEGDTVTYTYNSNGYKYTDKYKYECNEGTCGWVLDTRTMERITESIK